MVPNGINLCQVTEGYGLGEEPKCKVTLVRLDVTVDIVSNPAESHASVCTWMLPVKMICTKSQTAFKSTEVKFKLVEEFNATTTAVTLENGTLIQKQAWDGKQRSMERDGKQRLMERDGQQRSMERDGKL
uniref:Lipocalin/cytosolic fatty-acid binding domain-containing protein n=1 Tax=Paramormyrops kingsleyae TaxID=1676925 RepID=A0A3B3R0Z1_9TELE